jgi:MinD-like ATPase involved in chromosome partitioning or flagellar assembly
MRDIFGDLVFDTVIHRNVRLAEAPSAGEPVVTYAPQSRGAADYKTLAAEILQGEAAVQTAGRDSRRRGIQKRVAAIFDGVWVPRKLPERDRLNWGRIEAT